MCLYYYHIIIKYIITKDHKVISLLYGSFLLGFYFDSLIGKSARVKSR